LNDALKLGNYLYFPQILLKNFVSKLMTNLSKTTCKGREKDHLKIDKAFRGRVIALHEKIFF
tara:strand:- start:300 stop:485 length:186 start_codon:yes stop_codon:yes gene_type:complete